MNNEATLYAANLGSRKGSRLSFPSRLSISRSSPSNSHCRQALDLEELWFHFSHFYEFSAVK
jgi:hypothetical protein